MGRVQSGKLARLNQAYSFWEDHLEQEFAQALNGETRLNEYPLFDRIHTLVQRELALLGGATPNTRFIGAAEPFR